MDVFVLGVRLDLGVQCSKPALITLVGGFNPFEKY